MASSAAHTVPSGHRLERGGWLRLAGSGNPGSARYIGRVGGLTVALGLGIAIATTPGVAWADGTESTSSGGTAGAGATGTSGPSESEGSSTTGTTPDPTGTSTAAGIETEGASAPESGSVDASESSTSASTGASVRQVPPGTAMSTGGADPSTKSNSETSAIGDVAAELTTDDSTLPKPVAASTARHPEAPAAATAPVRDPTGVSNSQQPRVADPAAAPGVGANTLTATQNAVLSRHEISQPPRAIVDVAVHQPAVPQAVTALTGTSPSLPQTISIAAQAVSAAPEEPTSPRSAEVMRMLGLLAAAGSGPLAPTGPLTPVDSPLELALMAVGARPRQFRQVAEENQSQTVSLTLTSQTIDGLVTGDLNAAGDQDDQRALADRSTMQLSAPVTVDVAGATAPKVFAQGKAAAPSTKPDTKAPSVSLIGPANGATVSGTITLSATASDNVGVAEVRFFVDGTTQVGPVFTTTPYGPVMWNTTTVANGTHTLIARARDAAGNTKTSTVTVTVANPDTTAPTVSLTAPANGATVSGTVTLSATAADNVGVAEVRFFVDGTTQVGPVFTTTPYGPVMWNTTTVSNGTHTLAARARDAAGNTTTTSTVTVTVNNPDITAPTVSLTAPANGATVSGTVSLSATAADNVGVTGVRFLLDGNPLGAEDTVAPYGPVLWNTATVSNGTHTLAALARDAAGNTTTTSTVTVTVANPDTTSITIGRSTLVLPGGNGYAVNATWYFPNHDDPPVGLIYLQHGDLRTDTNLSALAQQLAVQTNSIVVAPTVSTNPFDRYYIWNEPIERAVAALFVGDRSELTASAAAAAGHPVTLPQQFVLAGHSAGGNLATAVAGYLADAGAAGNLKGVILFDSADDGDAITGMAKLTGANAVPVMSISAPPCPCNGFGAETNTIINSAPDNFIGIMLVGGSHIDAEGATTDWLGILGCGPAPTPQNAAAVQTITAAWMNDVFTGSHTGIYAPAGTVVAVNGATATVLAVKGQLLGQSAITA